MRILVLLRRDLARNVGSGSIWLPIAFFLLIATLFGFAVGPDPALLRRVGVSAIWTAALLAAFLPIERLVRPDLDSGVLDQFVVRGLSEEGIAASKLAAYWLSFGPPLMVASLPAAALLDLDRTALARLELGLLLGTPGLAGIGLTVAALTAALRGTGTLANLLTLPMSVPLLIFGAGSGPGELKLLAATSLLYVAVVPFVAGAALRAGRQ